MFDVEGARKAGYNDAEIAAHLAQASGFDVAGAKKAGYSDGELIAHLSGLSARAEIPTGAPGTPQTPQPKPQAAPSLAQRAVGAGEALLATGTGLVGGALGMVGGTAGATAASILDGSFGTPEALRMIEESAAAGAQKLTYAPRTQQGQEQTAVVGDAMQQLIPIAGLGGMTAQLGAAARPVAVAAADAARAAPSAVARGAEAVSAAVRRPGEPPAASPGTFGSVGAAGTDMAAQRLANAEQLPVPIRLTRGQATREQAQLRFETETAKDPAQGGRLRARSDEQNAALQQNFEALIDETGARATTPIEAGRAVDQALVSGAAKRKAEYRVKYQQAEKAGEMEAPVQLDSVVQHLVESAPDAATAPLLNVARARAVQLGIAVDDGAGGLTAQPVPLKTVERFRQAINRATDYEATNVRQSAIIKGLVDDATEGLGGNLYKEARKARQRYAQLFEDNAIVRDLLATRRGTSDRTVALENVFKRTILNGDRESVGKLRRTLHVAAGEEGAQAWKELQGATMRHLLDEATSNVATDQAGRTVFSAAKLDRAVKALDSNGRLDFVLTKRGAQTVRDLNDIAKVVMTAPPGTVNTSNTASVLLAALAEVGVSGSMTGLPVPVLSGLRLIVNNIKDRRIQRRVSEALREAEVANRRQQSQQARRAQTIH